MVLGIPWNEFDNGIAVDKNKFQISCQYANTTYEKINRLLEYQLLMYVVLVRDWKKILLGGETKRGKGVNIRSLC